jgi:hypothetical protein
MNGIRFSPVVMTAACLLLVVATRTANSQTLDPTGALAAAAAQNTTVYVVEKSGAVTRGRLTGVADGTLLLRVQNRPRPISLVDVARVEKRDSVRNGALIGGLVTLALWFIPMSAEGERCSVGCLPVGAYLFGLGAGIGAVVDLAIAGRVRLYEAGPDGGEPFQAPRAAIALAWRF